MAGPHHHGLPVLERGRPVESMSGGGMADVVSADEIAHVWRLMAALTRRDRVERPARS
ncbi:hypothetical protein [Candidatus Nephthysia bennettiae]|uniref:Uncharacterized protein n=1 Tax=Candidatus Nephthysia bennettiae TaxID=3127016 RepID=A0A934K730_9BACT|nr:hypothetical protein [Candidatus Dormibacteraeota bacterium]MBJ7612079.1 hypothetical protein [Candidatus Dormibacteraeota bacterium]